MTLKRYARCALMVTVDYQQIANGNIANQVHGFAIDYGKFILKKDMV